MIYELFGLFVTEMGNQYLKKKPNFGQILKAKTLITSSRPKQFSWNLAGYF